MLVDVKQLIEGIEPKGWHSHQLACHLDPMGHLLFPLCIVPPVEPTIEERIVQVDGLEVNLYLGIVEDGILDVMESQKRTREMLQDILNHPTLRLMSWIVVGQGPDVDISHLTQRGQFTIEKSVALPLEDARIEALPSQMLIDLCTPFREEGAMFGNALRFPDPIDEILFFGPLVLGQSSHGGIADTLYGLLFRQLEEMLPLRCTWRHRQSLASSNGNLYEFEEKHTYILKGICSLRNMALMNWGTFHPIFISLMTLGWLKP